MTTLKQPMYAIAVTVSVVVSGCATVDSFTPDYQKAIEDAAVATPNEVITELVQIVPYNQNLIWREYEAQQQVKVVTWTSWTGYDELVGQNYTASREIWVTTVPEVQNLCKRYPLDKDYITQRLEQLLGLPPNNGKDRFVEMWVTPNDLFRPCPDSEITDSACEIDFPVSAYIQVDADYKAWFEDLKASSYQVDGYPWTRLGYTYDWGHPEPLGASEFVINTGATVQIDKVTSTFDYCR